MRHFSSLLFVFFISWILFSCSDNDSENNFTPPPSTLEEKFELDVLEYTVDKNGGDVVVDFTTNTSWSLFTDVDWVVANPDKGNSKDDFVTLEIAPNETGEERRSSGTFGTDADGTDQRETLSDPFHAPGDRLQRRRFRACGKNRICWSAERRLV